MWIGPCFNALSCTHFGLYVDIYFLRYTAQYLRICGYTMATIHECTMNILKVPSGQIGSK
jgi:hypothetical protein